jgi:hypothetical protein
MTLGCRPQYTGGVSKHDIAVRQFVEEQLVKWDRPVIGGSLVMRDAGQACDDASHLAIFVGYMGGIN